MASLFAKLPLINLWAWANGNEYTIDEEGNFKAGITEKNSKLREKIY